MLYTLKKPNLSKINSKKIFKLAIERREELLKPVFATLYPIYLYWDKAKYKPRPADITAEEFWALVKLIRNNFLVKSESVIKSESGNLFAWIRLPMMEKFFHEMDLNMGGNLFILSKDINEKDKYRFISRGVMEEAIASSQLEGANTSRKAAKQFLREGKAPRTKGECMILNNYQAMQAIEENYKERKLDLGTIFEMHQTITKNTIPENEQGRFRTDKENIIVGKDDIIYHQPPKIKFVKEEMERLIKFANDEIETGFLHPVLKAIMIHFWIGYLHPFTDGNGRIARLLFYWYLLKNGYWAFAYLPISKIIKKSPVQYGDAYVYSEQDDYDLTYFIDYNIRKIEQAVRDFEEYLKKKAEENSRMNKLSRTKYHFNDRQIQLMEYFYEDKDARTTLKTHINVNRISKATAIKDLKILKKLGFLISEKKGSYVYYYPTDKIRKLLE